MSASARKQGLHSFQGRGLTKLHELAKAILRTLPSALPVFRALRYDDSYFKLTLETHLEMCERCAAETYELRQFTMRLLSVPSTLTLPPIALSPMSRLTQTLSRAAEFAHPVQHRERRRVRDSMSFNEKHLRTQATPERKVPRARRQ